MEKKKQKEEAEKKAQELERRVTQRQNAIADELREALKLHQESSRQEVADAQLQELRAMLEAERTRTDAQAHRANNAVRASADDKAMLRLAMVQLRKLKEEKSRSRAQRREIKDTLKKTEGL